MSDIGKAHQEICVELEKRCGELVVAHTVFPDPRLGRVPWIEIRVATDFPVELEEEIEQRWPTIDFDVVHTDEDGL